MPYPSGAYKKIAEELCGLGVSSSQVIGVTKLLDEEIGEWRNRSLGIRPYVALDARSEKVRIGVVVNDAFCVAMGVREDGQRTSWWGSAATSWLRATSTLNSRL